MENAGDSTEVMASRSFVITPDAQGYRVIDNGNNYYKPGDVLYLKGKFKAISVYRLSGTASAPITIREYPGTVVTIGNPNWNGGSWAHAMAFSNCHHIKLGALASRSSFVITGSKQAARPSYFNIILNNHTDNIEVRNLTMTDGGTGIVAKTEPIKSDASSWYPNSTLQNLSIHNLNIGSTANEAMYIGHTATYWDLSSNTPYYGSSSGFTSGHQYVQPIKWRNVKIYDNFVHGTGADGIQTAAIDQLQIYRNEVTNWATQHNYAHNGGILVGGRTTNTSIHDNYVHNGWGELLQFYGSGENAAKHSIHNNLFRDNQNDGMSLRGTNNAVVQITNNTIARTGGVCIRVNGNSGMKEAEIARSNALLQPNTKTNVVYSTSYIYTENGGRVIEGTGTYVNKKISTVTAAKVDVSNYYQPLSGSLLGSAGYRKL